MSEHDARYRARQDAFMNRLFSQIDVSYREILWRAFRDDALIAGAGAAALCLETPEEQLAVFGGLTAVALAERNAQLLDIGRRLDAAGLSTEAIADFLNSTANLKETDHERAPDHDGP